MKRKTMKKSYLTQVFLFALVFSLTTLLLVTCKSTSAENDVLANLQTKLNVVTFPTTVEQITQECNDAIKMANERIQAIVDEPNNTFENTIAALDEVFYQMDFMIGPQYLLNNVSTDQAIQEACEQSYLKYDEWVTQIYFREDLYQAVDRFRESKPKLTGEELKLYEEILRNFKRNGFELPPDQRKEMEEMKIEIGKLASEFQKNARTHDNKVIFTMEELEGVPESALKNLEKDGNGNYLMDSRIWGQYAGIADFAVQEETRYKAHVAKRSIAKDTNPELLKKIVAIRYRIAQMLGYNTFADYQTEVKMAQKGDIALDFLKTLANGVEKKFQEELEELRLLKVRETDDPNAVLNYWDNRYYSRILNEEKYDIDMEAVKKYFPMEYCLEGMFNLYQNLFSITIEQKNPPNGFVWYDDVTYYEVIDNISGQLLGSFYLDLYPRELKYSHFAHFGLQGGKKKGDVFERPVSALVCNFPKPSKDTPSLLSFDEVLTLFHEFGHCMHSMLSITNFFSYHGTSTVSDFVEAPSQMLEQFLMDKAVLDTFAVNYQDPNDKIPQDFLDKYEKTLKASIAQSTRGQVAYGMIDLTLHTQYGKDENFDLIKVTNQILKDYWMDYGTETSFVTGFTHLASNHYAAGYYGYKWAEAISYDMAELFRSSPKGFLDEELGMKLRHEIYQPGGSRDENQSIKAFLGRKWNNNAFFKYLGIN
ncbi:MAG: Zn-dependent oligopeptidase [Spirochaetes bacterium]|nr:Zn-dependent oligopeptidase [Spirochaetota bacterium]